MDVTEIFLSINLWSVLLKLLLSNFRAYTSKWTNDYSMILTGSAFLHRYYFHLYTDYLSPHFHKTVEQV